MAQKTVTFCDECDRPETDSFKVLPSFFKEEGKELCFECASKALRELYGVEEKKASESIMVSMPVDMDADMRAYLKRKSELEDEYDQAMHVIKPAGTAVPGERFMHGKPPRTAEFVEEVVGKPGFWFVKVLGEMS